MVAAFAAHITATVGPCVRVAPGAAITFRRVQRLFFLAEGQDMTRFLVTKLGVVKYPPYRRGLPPHSKLLFNQSINWAGVCWSAAGLHLSSVIQ